MKLRSAFVVLVRSSTTKSVSRNKKKQCKQRNAASLTTSAASLKRIAAKPTNKIALTIMLVFDFPTVIREMMISSWLDILDFVQFDSAICSTVVREKFFQNNTFRFPLNGDIILSSFVLKWMILRGVTMKGMSISLNNLNCPVDLESAAFREFCKGVYELVLNENWTTCCPYGLSILPYFRHSLRSLRLTEFHDNLTDILSNFSSLENVFVITNFIYPGIVKRALEACSIVKGFGFNGNVYDTFIFKNMHKFMHLTKLRVNNSKVTGVAVMALLNTHKIKFHELCVRGCALITNELIDELASDTESCAALRMLEVSNTAITLSAGVHKALNSFPNLTHLAAGDLPRVAYSAFVTNRTFALKYLDFSQRERGYLHNDTPLLSDDMVQDIVKHCPNLAHVDLTNCVFISESTVSCLASFCKMLKFVDLTCTEQRYTNVKYCCSGLAELVRTNRHIHTLKIGRRVTNLKMISDVLTTYPSKLTTLDLSDCKRITSDDGAIALIKHCRKLVNLNLTNCNKLTDDVLQSVQMHCTRLSDLTIVGCAGFSTKRMADIVMNFKFQKPGYGLTY